MNPFDVLEISPDASPEDIKTAYHRLAKLWHPDRYSGAEKVVAEERFREVAEAFSILKDPGKRLTMLQQTPRPQPVKAIAKEKEVSTESPRERTPEDWAAQAKAAFDEGQVDQARALIHYAIRLDEGKPQYHALLASILEREGGDLRAIVKALETVVRLSPRDVDSHIRLAGHFQTLGMAARALRHLQAAREISPHHPKLRQAGPQGGRESQVQPRPGAKGKAPVATAASGSLMDQLKDLWGRLTGRG